jgi:integrase
MGVTLRKKPIKNGLQQSLYLDFYPAVKNPVNGEYSRREFLGIYILTKPVTEFEKELNKEKVSKAEALRGLREMQIINEKFDFIDKSLPKQNFLAYFKEVANKKSDNNWEVSYLHFHNFTKGVCTIGDVTPELANRFREYLLNANQIKSSKNPTKLAVNSALSYYGKFRALLKQAYKEKKLSSNVNDFIEGIKEEETSRDFLTIEEVLKLNETACECEVLKNASLFSCLSGLRFSDIEKLRWSEIQKDVAGDTIIRFRQKKTKGFETMPLNSEAFELLGTPSEPNEKVFKGLKYNYTQAPLKKWLKDAGISRNITFHCFRHTYATLQLEADTDIYTIQKMLGHKKIETTQIYTHLLDKKKKDTTNKITLIRKK